MAVNNNQNQAKKKMITLMVIWTLLGIIFTVVLALVQPFGIQGIKGALSVGWHLPNFLILVTILWYFGRGPLKEHLVQRRAGLAEAIAEAERQKLAAEDRHQEYREKLDRIGEEMAGLKQAMREEAEREKERILAAARDEAARIRHEAEFTSRQELSKARAALREEAAALTVELAEKVIRQVINDQDQERILRDYLGREELKP
ncbi:MAG: hypothetical protein A2V67_13425 [Deltaproteobacteria bacterium RBG_13_61_14]|nr:MAG: hypothetical protein A2V67_13425 [Deltaproteobacteria bacterium RBG_13_61_14]